jgi:hypothetical protein
MMACSYGVAFVLTTKQAEWLPWMSLNLPPKLQPPFRLSEQVEETCYAKVVVESLLAVGSLLAADTTDLEIGPSFTHPASGFECFKHALGGTITRSPGCFGVSV